MAEIVEPQIKKEKKPVSDADCGKAKCKSLILEGTKYRTLFTKKFETLKPWQKPDPRQVISFIPGTVLKVLVKKGEKVTKGQELLLIEAMKMQNKIGSPMNGTVKNILVQPGDRIHKGVVMIELK